MPFVRLALVRYQPFAPDHLTMVTTELPPDHAGYDADMRVSDVVLADLVQLAPQRSTSLVADTTDPARVRLTITAPG